MECYCELNKTLKLKDGNKATIKDDFKRFLQKYDTDGDGKVSVPEINQMIWKRLEELNRDSVVKPGDDVSKLDQEIFKLINEIRTKPTKFMDDLKEKASRFEKPDYKNLNRPGRTLLATREGKAAVDDAMKFIMKIKPVGKLNWNKRLYEVSKKHTKDIGSKGLVQHESSDGTPVKERL